MYEPSVVTGGSFFNILQMKGFNNITITKK